MTDSTKPRFIQGLVILAWGFQADLFWVALPMALSLEARYYINRRWALEKLDFYRVADLTSIGLLGLLLFLFLNARTYHFITTLLEWLPILFFPLTIVYAYSTTERMSLDVMFHSLRKQKEPVQQSWDMDYFLFGLALLAAGISTAHSTAFFPLAAIAILWSLYPLRSKRYQRSFWVLAITIAILTGSFTHQFIRESHLAFKAKTEQWIARWLARRTDPLKTRTAFGKVGQLKLSDSILFRIQSAGGIPNLIHEASYDHVDDGDGMNWSIWDPGFETVNHEDDFRWRFAPRSEHEGLARVFLEFDREYSLVPVPAALSEISDLPALDVKMNAYGAIQGTGLVPSPYYDIRYGSGQSIYSKPTKIDTLVPENYQLLLSRIIDKDQYPGPEAVAFVRSFLGDYKYSLFQDEPRPSVSPLEHFLFVKKAGHCEYFANATTLLLRYMGIPARYVVGYSTTEYNEGIDMYIIRQRHAHAWTIAWINGSWQVVDTTPSTWFAAEHANEPLLQPLVDLLANYTFVFQLWWNDQKIEDYEVELYVIGALLALILLWRITTSEQVILTDERSIQKTREFPGSDSPFFKLEHYLTEIGLKRGRGELLRDWLVRIQKTELLPLLAIHNRWRFDPFGVNQDDKALLDQTSQQWLADQEPK